MRSTDSTFIILLIAFFSFQNATAFQTSRRGILQAPTTTASARAFNIGHQPKKRRSGVVLNLTKDEEEEARLKTLAARRETIRTTLKDAESLRNFRLDNGFVPEIDEETGKPIKSDSKLALTLTAFVIAAGAVTLRVGGRAALASAIGLDFANGENAELRENMDQFLSYAGSLNPGLEALIFVLAWTAVKVFCFDAGGIVLALSAGILFGGVIQGALASALAASIGSSVAFFLAKVDTPVRKKALELLEENPSLRGIEKVVAEDGLKAILTLRLAPVLPIPIGFYNYVYGVTNVPFFDFFGGIFIGSFKPYLLDSYLGYFGKQLIEGTAGESGGVEDIILLVVLGVSVLIGVFASQLAGETWDSVKEEIEAEQKKKIEDGDAEVDDGIVRKVAGMDVPQWIIGMQLSIQEANERMEKMIVTEYNAAVWNYTDAELEIPRGKDPATFPDSPEIEGAGTGFDFGRAICDGFVLSPALLSAYFKYGDPLYEEPFDESYDKSVTTSMKDATSGSDNINVSMDQLKEEGEVLTKFMSALDQKVNAIESDVESAAPLVEQDRTGQVKTTEMELDDKERLLNFLALLRSRTEKKLQDIKNRIEALE